MNPPVHPVGRDQRHSALPAKTALLLSLTPVAREARLLRQAESLRAAGWRVVAAGLGGDQPMPDWLPLIELKPRRLPLSLIEEWSLRGKRYLSRWKPALAEAVYYGFMGNDVTYEHLAFVNEVKADLIVAHEYFSAPLAHRLAARWNAKLVVDCHEVAAEQYEHDPDWVRVWKPYVIAIESQFLPKADAVTTINDGIAGLLHEAYDLRSRPLVLRSTPLYEAHAYRTPGEEIVVHYHGLVSPMRGLEVLVESVKQWRPEFRLDIRGMAAPDYEAELRAWIERQGVGERVRILPRVDFRDMIKTATSADIGIFVQETPSRHKILTLPNKIFEYIMAGLAICVLDLPEMGRIVRDHGVGRTVATLDPDAVAEVINGFTREDLARYKARSLEVAKTLCWEVEGKPFVELCRRLVGDDTAIPLAS